MNTDPVRESIKEATADILKYGRMNDKNTEDDS